MPQPMYVSRVRANASDGGISICVCMNIILDSVMWNAYVVMQLLHYYIQCGGTFHVSHLYIRNVH